MWSIVISPSVCLSVCLSPSISLEPLDRSAWHFCAHPAWPSIGPPLAALRCYVFPVLWITSRLAVVDKWAVWAWMDLASRSNAPRWVVTCETAGRESDVYECLVLCFLPILYFTRVLDPFYVIIRLLAGLGVPGYSLLPGAWRRQLGLDIMFLGCLPARCAMSIRDSRKSQWMQFLL